MQWQKKGLIFNADGFAAWAQNGAMIPTPMVLDSETIRVFLTFLDANGIGRTGFVDLDQNNLKQVKNYSKDPLFEIGSPGAFDDNGAVTCSVVKIENGDLYFYYAGFELGHHIRYRLLTGLTILDANYQVKYKSTVPVLERSESELLFRCGPFCLREDGIFKMWYVAGSAWVPIQGKQMPVYEIKYAESLDGIHWPAEGKTCIAIECEDEHGFGRPYVIKQAGLYKMFYSIRMKQIGYRLGYAESSDGIKWVRKDKQLNLNVSPADWDSDMLAYTAVVELKDRVVMFYNGNQFGGSGFGYAELI